MKTIVIRTSLVLLLPALWLLDFGSETLPGLVLVQPAQAVVGRPATPVSVAGVARRTTRRAVVYSSTASANATQQQQASAPPPQQAAAAPALPAGTIVTALPAGCESVVVDGVNLFNCSGVMYQPTFQSNNLVYVVK